MIDWFRVGQVSIVALENRRRGHTEPDAMDFLVVDNHLARAGVPEGERARALMHFTRLSSAGMMGRASPSDWHHFDNHLQTLAAQQDRPVMKPNIWVNGSFFLVAMLSIFVAIRVLSGEVAPIWIAVVFIGGILAVLTIGVLALRANEQIGDKTFLQALGLVIRSLPLIARAARRP